MSQILVKNKKHFAVAQDSNAEVTAQLQRETTESYFEKLEKAVETSEKFKKDFIKMVSDFEQLAHAIRDSYPYLPYEQEVKLSAEQIVTKSANLKLINSNLNMREMLNGIYL